MAEGVQVDVEMGTVAGALSRGEVVCFFQSAEKFGARYGTLGFNDSAHLDDGDKWPSAYALKALNAADEAKISELVKKAVS